MRILFTSRPASGHVNPMLPLAIQARLAGHAVAFATGAELVPELERRRFETWRVGPSRAEADASVLAAHPNLGDLPAEQRLPVLIQGVFVDSAAKRAVDLVPRAAQWRPDIVVHEATELAGALTAARTGARHVVHGFGLPPPAGMWESMFAPGFARLCEQWQVPGLAKDIRLATYLDICPPSLRGAGEPAWRRIMPLRPVAGEPADGERLPETLAALPHPQTIYLTLGTIFNKAPGVLETAIAGLREFPLNLVVTTGPDTDPARFGPQPRHVLIEPFIPHTLLLQRCSFVVSHGGAGTMLGALAHGLPQLFLPQGADQFMNAAACQRAGAALALAPDGFSAAAVTAATRRLIDEPEFEAAAARIRAEIAAMPTAADVLAGDLAGSPGPAA